MRITEGLVVAAVAAFIGVVSLWQFGCEDQPTKPKPPEPKDYPVYFYNNSNSTLWIFHPHIQQLDSVVVPFDETIRGVTVSADGRLLYLSEGGRVFVLTTDSLRLVAELPYSAWRGTAISPADGLLAIMGDDINILRTTDWSVVFSDTTRLSDGVFSSDSRTFYAGEIDLYGLCWVRPLDSNPSLQRKNFLSSVIQMKPTPDGSKLIMSLLWHFLVYDIDHDSILFDLAIWPGTVRLGMTPDGKYGFFANPSTPHGEPGTTDLYVFDIRANRDSGQSLAGSP